MGKLLDELKRRKVFKVGAVYALVTWVLIQVADVVLPTFGAPEWVNQTLIFIFILGFPLAIILSWAYDVTPEGIRAEHARQDVSLANQSSDRKLIYAIFALVLLVAGFQISDRFLTIGQQSTATTIDSFNPSVMRSEFAVEQPLARRFTGVRAQLGISPDGSQLIYGDMPVDGGALQFLHRDLRTGATRVLTTSASLGSLPEFSPDSQRVLLTARPRILIASMAGGLPEFVSIDESSGRAGNHSSWFSNSEILYIIGYGESIYKKSLETGIEERIATASEGMRFQNPQALPGRRAILYSNLSLVGSFNDASIEVHDLESNTSKSIISGGYLPRYASSGHIVFLRSGDLWAAPFNLESLELTGTEVKVLEGIDSQPTIGMGSYTFSDSGRLIYLDGVEYDFSDRSFQWVDRTGYEEEITQLVGNNLHPEISPDGSMLAVSSIANGTTGDVWIYDFNRETFNPITFTGDSSAPKWMPNGAQIVHDRRSGGFWLINADGTGEPELILDITGPGYPNSISNSDGALIFVSGPGAIQNLNSLSYRDSTWISSPLIESPFNTWGGSVSPDGRWIAYVSNESGREEVFVRPYPDVNNGKYPVSTQGGREPKWGPNSDELFYLTLQGGELMSVTINPGSEFSANTPKSLLSGFMVNVFNPPSYAVSRDGQRFLRIKAKDGEFMQEDSSSTAKFTVVENWFEELKRLAPPDPQ